MNTSVRILIPLLWATLLAVPARGQGTAFTYQGALAQGGLPANGTYDLRFAVHDTPAGGGPGGAVLELAGVAISNGLFTVMLDFGPGIFTGPPRWLQIGVRPGGGGGAYTLLSPRQPFASAPYAIVAASISGPVSSDSVGGAYWNTVFFTSPGNVFAGTFDGNGTGLTGLHAGNIASGVLPVARGGTGAGTAAGARAGLGAAARGANVDITSLSGLSTPLSIEQGGTGSSTASDALTGLGAASLTESNTFSGVNTLLNAQNSFVGVFTGNGVGLAGLNAGGISSGLLSMVRGGTGASTPAGARASLGAAARGANSDITSLSGLSTPLSIEQGGTGANTGVGALANLGAVSLTESNEFTGVIRMLNASNSFVGAFYGDGTGLTGLDAGCVSTGVLSVARGGTGASNSLEALLNLGAASLTASNSFIGVNLMLNASNSFIGVFTGNGAGLTGLDASRISAGVLPVARGGTGASTISNALANLGAASLTASNTFTGVSLMLNSGNRFAGDGAGLTGLDASRVSTGVLSVARGGTGASTVSSALVNLGAASLTTSNNFAGVNLMLNGGNRFAGVYSGDGAGLTGLDASQVSTGVLSVARGGTGTNNLSNLLANLGTVSLTASNNFTGLNLMLNASNRFAGMFAGDGAGLTGLDASQVSTGVLSVARGGTGTSNISNLLANLGGVSLTGSNIFTGVNLLLNTANVVFGSFSGNGTALTNLNASNLATGTVPDARLSTNVAMLAGGDLSASRLNVGLGHTLTGTAATISGGSTNTATGLAATVPGGGNNAATGDFSLAAGQGAKANHSGTLVWADATDADFSSSAPNQFLIRAGGGVAINTTNPAGKTLLVNGTVGVRTNHTLEFGVEVPGKQANAGKIGYEALTPGALDIVGAGTNATSRRIKFWAEGGATFNGTGTNALMTLVNTVDEPASISFAAPFSTWQVGQNKPPDAPGAFDSFFIYQQSANATRLLITDTGRVGLGTNNPIHPLHLGNGAHCTASGVWSSVSDRDAKTNFAPVNPREVLAQVAAMPVSQWRYKVEDEDVKHIGPTAQDFHDAFGLGESDRAIGSVDADGVALAAIQGLNSVVLEQEVEIHALQSRNRKLEQRLEALESLVRRASTAANGGNR